MVSADLEQEHIGSRSVRKAMLIQQLRSRGIPIEALLELISLIVQEEIIEVDETGFFDHTHNEEGTTE